ncbi:calcium-binding protein [Pseudanabaena sp. PCC 6802]|uniref:calcium-binding protein n=1 Tax=Pseudanabaena sp. PCC 6802 TaxID=118173 RepID=UPI000347B5FD|nr:calcium-binding protein [Pseudanabaena sp. PCC 6802]
MAIIGNPTPGNDSITGDALPNLIDALAGNDTVNGLGGNDTLIGGADNDFLFGADGNDILSGGLGNDQLVGDNFGGAGNDSLNGGAGSDILNGGLGIDTLVGGADNDTYAVGVFNTSITELANEGNDIVNSSVSFTLPANVERLTLVGTGNTSGGGNDLGNLMLGNAGNNNLSGLAGNDTINGLDGNDTLRGGLGNDALFGGNGIDRVFVNAAVGSNIVLTDTSVTGDGTDSLNGIENAELFVFSNNSAPVNIDASAFTKGSVTLDGNSGSNNLLGSQGSDFLDGEGSVDTLIGGNGNDTLNGGEGSGTDILTGSSGSDRFLFDMNRPLNSGDDFDRITDFAVGTDKIVLDKTTFTALASGPGSLLASDFEVVDSVFDIQFSNAKIVYHRGTLVYNQNGSLPGLLTVGGTGGVIADISGAPNLSLSDFVVVA